MNKKVTKQSRHLVLILALYKGYITFTGNLIIKDDNRQNLIWKQQLLKQVNICSHIIQYNSQYYLITKKYTFIQLYRKIALKKITPRLIPKLNLLDLAILYNDIGQVRFKKQNGKIHALRLNLYTNSLMSINQLLIDYIKEKWQIQFFQLKYKKYYYLSCNTKMAKKFLQLIDSIKM